MLCNVIHDINKQLSLNYVSRGKHKLHLLINYTYLGPVCSFTLLQVHPVDPFHNLDNLKNQFGLLFCRNSAVYIV